MMYRIGLDVGSTTAKMVVVSPQKKSESYEFVTL